MLKPLNYIFLFAILLARIAWAEPILTASSETVTAGEKSPAPTLVDALLSSVDQHDAALFSECLNEFNINKSRRHMLFKAVTLPKLAESEVMYFVRPALRPYCQAFYGAHAFQYWLVIEKRSGPKKTYRILYTGIGDDFEVLPSKHMGYFDIIETNCTAVGCRSATMHYNGREYMPFSCCEVTSDKNGREVTNEIPCSH
jgi:hypothetical protein